MAITVFGQITYYLTTLLALIDKGQIALPDIQRPFIWKSAKVRDLFDSMYRGFPVGHLLFWATGAEAGAKRIRTHKPESAPQLMIVDGQQQRLTSLYAVLMGKGKQYVSQPPRSRQGETGRRRAERYPISDFPPSEPRELPVHGRATRGRRRPSPANRFIDPSPDQMLRVVAGLAFRRARLRYVYQVLRGKDLEFLKAVRRAGYCKRQDDQLGEQSVVLVLDVPDRPPGLQAGVASATHRVIYGPTWQPDAEVPRGGAGVEARSALSYSASHARARVVPLLS